MAQSTALPPTADTACVEFKTTFEAIRPRWLAWLFKAVRGKAVMRSRLLHDRSIVQTFARQEIEAGDSCGTTIELPVHRGPSDACAAAFGDRFREQFANSN